MEQGNKWDGSRKDSGHLPLNDDVSFLEEETVASSMDCTGLIPTPPEDENEARSYAEMHTIPTPDPKRKPRQGE